MNIYGLQKLTLLDYPEHTACTVFLSGCNFDCPYCYNKELAHKEVKPLMSSIRFLSWLDTMRGKLDGVCISGGEPTLCGLLGNFISAIKNMNFLVKLDTNGYRTSVLLSTIYEHNIDYIAMDIKNSPKKYAITAGFEGAFNFDIIETSVDVIMTCKHLSEYEFRTTVTKSMHDDSDFEEIGRLIRGAKRYFLQKCTTDTPSDEDMQRYKSIMEKYVDYVGIRG